MVGWDRHDYVVAILAGRPWEESTVNEQVMEQFIAALLDGDRAKSLEAAKQLAADGVSTETIVADGVQAAMQSLSDKCTVESFNLLEIMLAGRAVMTVMKHFFPADESPPAVLGTVVVVTLEGDVHDLGKNILKMVLMGNGYKVVDCGKNCSVDRLMAAVEEHQPQYIGISGLITSVSQQVQQIKDQLQERGLGHIRVLAGGAALKQATAKYLKVDFVAETAFDGADYIKSETGEDQP